MQNIPFHIAYLLTQHEYVIVPGLGAFIVSPPDVEKTGRWRILSPPVNSLEFDPEIKDDDGLLANSIEEERQCSYSKACSLINIFVTHTFNTFDRKKSMHIPWVGFLYLKNNRILFEPDKTLSCNALNYGLAGFSLPYLEDLRQEAAALPQQNKSANYLKQSSLASPPPPRRSSVTNYPKQNSVAVRPQVDKKETYSFTGNMKLIIYACSVVALIAMLLIPLSLKNGKSGKSTNIVQMPAWNQDYNEENVSETEIQIPADSIVESTREPEIKLETEPAAEPVIEPVRKPVTEPARKPAMKPTREPIREPVREPVREPAAKSKVESIVTQTETPVNNPRTIANNRDASYFYIVVASWPNEIYAKNAQSEFHSKGFRDTGILHGDNKYRIYINRFEDKKDAEKFLIQFRQDNPTYGNAWILKQ